MELDQHGGGRHLRVRDIQSWSTLLSRSHRALVVVANGISAVGRADREFDLVVCSRAIELRAADTYR